MIKYENVRGIGGIGGVPGTCPDEGAEMPLAAIVDGIYSNFLLEEDTQTVITKFQQPPLPRFDYKNSGASALWVKTYEKMDLWHVYGFPLWEEGVFKVLGDALSELKLIFQQYAKTGSSGSANVTQLYTMQKTELTNLSLDCGLATEDFPQSRVTNVFERANKVDEQVQHAKVEGTKKVRPPRLESQSFGPRCSLYAPRPSLSNDSRSRPCVHRGKTATRLPRCRRRRSSRRSTPGWSCTSSSSASCCSPSSAPTPSTARWASPIRPRTRTLWSCRAASRRCSVS
jgi:hypothetical protein